MTSSAANQQRRWRAPARPQVTLKAAVTLDGKLATRSGDSKWITSLPARKHAHLLRARSDAVMVGVGTALADDPELNVRLTRGRNPLRVVLDTHLRLPPSSKLASVSDDLATLVFHGPGAPRARRKRLQARGISLCEAPLDAAGRLRLRAVLRELSRRGVERLLCEGGAELHGAMLDAGLVDRVAVFIAPRILGDAAAPSFAAGKPRRRMAQAQNLLEPELRRLGPDVLITGALRR